MCVRAVPRHQGRRVTTAFPSSTATTTPTRIPGPTHPVANGDVDAHRMNVVARSALATDAAEPSDRLDRLNRVVEQWLGSTVLLTCTLLSMAVANTPRFSGPWLRFWESPSLLRVAGHALSYKAVVNEGLMALFFFFVGLEIKKEAVEGTCVCQCAIVVGDVMGCVCLHQRRWCVCACVCCMFSILNPTPGSLSSPKSALLPCIAALGG